MKILIAVETSEEARALEAKLRQEGFDVVLAGSSDEARLALQRDGAPKIALLGGNLPPPDALTVCREVRHREAAEYTYIILILDQGSKAETLDESLKAGADDFLIRPYEEAEWRARLRAGRRILGLQQDLKASQEALNYQVSHDPLTGVWNRTAILDVLRRELTRGRREKSPVGVLVVLVDKLKEINERYGSAVGDAALRGTSRKLRAALRPYDSIGRLGSDQFLIIAPGNDPKSAEGQAERLRAVTAGEPLDIAEWGKNMPAEKANLSVTISLGVTTSEADQSPEMLLQAAASAADRTRESGGNRVEVASRGEPAAATAESGA